MSNWTRNCFAFAMMSLASLLPGCGGMSTTPPSPQATASFRFVQQDPSAGTVDVMMDSMLVKGSVAYTTDTGYLTVNAGAHQLLVQPPGGSPKPFVNGMVTLDSGTRNTFILGGWGPFSTMGLPLTDDTIPASGGIKLRIADLTAEATNIDIFVLQPPNTPSGAPTIRPTVVPFASSYLALPAGTYDVFVTSFGTTNVLFHTGPMTFSAGQNRTVVLSNDCLPTSCGFNSFKATTLADMN